MGNVGFFFKNTPFPDMGAASSAGFFQKNRLFEKAPFERDARADLAVLDGNRGFISYLRLSHDKGRFPKQAASGMDNDPIMGYVLDLDILADFNTLRVGNNHAFLYQLIYFLLIGIHKPSIDLIAHRIDDYDAICSFACGVGVQHMAERFPSTPVYAGLNTQFMGALVSQGVWTEKCVGCGDCRTDEFAGICPLSRCAKQLLNGPCGGSQDGVCEVRPDLECGWQLIYDRAKAIGTLDKLEAIAAPHDWSNSTHGGPRKVVREDQRIANSGQEK